MGVSKARKDKRTSAAAKQRRRIDRKTKGRRPNAPVAVPGGDRWAVPVWDYPRVAKMMVEEDGMEYERSLEVLLLKPICIHFKGEQPEIIDPREVMRQEGMNAQEYIASLATLHDLGLMMWDKPSRSHRPSTPGTGPAVPAPPAVADGSGRGFGPAVGAIIDTTQVGSFNTVERATIDKLDEVDALLAGRGWTLEPDSDFEGMTWRFPMADLPSNNMYGTGITLSPIESGERGPSLYRGDLGTRRCEVEFPVPHVEGEPGRYSDYFVSFEKPLDVMLSSLGLIEALRFGEDPEPLRGLIR